MLHNDCSLGRSQAVRGRSLLQSLFVGMSVLATLITTARCQYYGGDICSVDGANRLICLDPYTSKSFEFRTYGQTDNNYTTMHNLTLATELYLVGGYGLGAYGGPTERKKHELDQRTNWVNCEENNGFLTWAACDVARRVTGGLSDLSLNTLQALINEYIGNAFTNQRDNQNPRAMCHNYDGGQICISWSEYSPHGMYNGQPNDLANFAASCIRDGMSAEMKTRLIGGQFDTICASNRANGCTNSPNSC
ncbi:hypothetical protein V1509DRAFT_635870 [Lipomyces kononenkoae]